MLLKMSLAQALGARNASEDVSGRGTWSKTCFRMSLARHLEQEMIQDKRCFRMSLAKALGARNA